jgi:multidrug efflux pump subunit AcrA (membrane-fusion protein)
MEFVRRYHAAGLRPLALVEDRDAQAACVKILATSGIAQVAEAELGQASGRKMALWELGRTKIFLKYFVVDLLASELERHHKKAVALQAVARGFLARGQVASLRAAKAERVRREREEAEQRAREEAERQRREEEERRRRQAEEMQRSAAIARRKEEELKRRAAEADARRDKEEAERHARIEADRRRKEQAQRRALAPLNGVNGKPAPREMVVEPFSVAEYNAIDMALVKKGRIPPGTSHLNRYNNILPNPRTRVRLAKVNEDELSCYINANYIHGWDGGHGAYIATQGPTPQTVGDFWRLAWESNSRAIVMVTGLKEQGKEKCARYWPTVLYNEEEQLGDMQAGDLNVAVLAGVRSDGYIASKLRVRKSSTKEERIVMHYWFNSWPDQ